MLVLGLYKEDYLQILKMCVLLITQLLRLVGKLDPVNRFHHTSKVAIVIPTDRPTSVRNRCVIEVLVMFLCCHVVFFS